MMLTAPSLTVAALLSAFLVTATPTLAQGQPQEGQRQRQPGGGAGGGGGRMGGMGGMGGMGMGGMQQAFEPPVNSRDLDKYALILSLDKEQTEALTALLEANQQEFNDAAKTAREQIENLREEAREARDPEAWRAMGTQMETFRKARQKMEDSFFADFKAVLTEEQAQKFPRIERQRRREQTIGRGLMSGERVDLIRSVEDLKLTPDQVAALQPTIDLYEADLDRELITRNAVYEESQTKIREMFEAGNMDDMQKVLEKGREASKRVRDVNRRYARQLETMIPDDAQAKFTDEIRRESFPTVYRTTQATRAIDAAKAFADLEETQKAALDAIGENYTRELGTLNKQLEAATLEREESLTAQDLMSRGMGGGFGGGEDGPVGELRQKRRDLDSTTMDKLRALLTPEQIENLPKREDRGGPGGAGEIGGDGNRRQRPRQRPAGGGDEATPPPDSRT